MPESHEVLKPPVFAEMEDIITAVARRLHDGYDKGYYLSLIHDREEPTNLMERMQFLEDRKRATSYHNLLAQPNVAKMEDLAISHSSKIWQRELRAPDNEQRPPEATTLNVLLAAIGHASEFGIYSQVTGGGLDVTGMAYVDRFLSNLAFEAANRFYGVQDRKAYLGTVHNLAKSMSEYPEDFTTWPGWQCQKFEAYLLNNFSILDILMDQVDTGPESPEELKVEADGLWQETEKLRRFGVKSAIAPTTMPGLAEICIRPGFEMLDLLSFSTKKAKGNPEEAGRFALRGARATFTISNLPQARTAPKLEIKYTGEKLGDPVGAAIPLERFVEASPEEVRQIGIRNRLATIQLRPDGQLYTLQGTPLERWSYELGCPEAYEQLRLECLSLYYDLVVPVYIQHLAKAQVVKQFGTSHSAGRLKEMAAIRRRILVERQPEIISKLEEDEAEAKNHAKRSTAKHPVTGHPRELPENFCATLEARVMAWKEDGRVLPDSGQTWVKFHDRGDTGIIEIPRIKPGKGKYGGRYHNRQKKTG